MVLIFICDYCLVFTDPGKMVMNCNWSRLSTSDLLRTFAAIIRWPNIRNGLVIIPLSLAKFGQRNDRAFSWLLLWPAVGVVQNGLEAYFWLEAEVWLAVGDALISKDIEQVIELSKKPHQVIKCGMNAIALLKLRRVLTPLPL